MLFKAVLGPGAAPPYKPPDDVTPQCLERAVVVRQRDTYNADECSPEAQDIRRVVRAYCRYTLGLGTVLSWDSTLSSSTLVGGVLS